jgi:carbon monoxide dehydrogenase subunit G
MARIDSTLPVLQPIEDVFSFLNTPEGHSRFIPNIAEFKQTSPGEFAKVGATAQGLLSYFGLVKIPVQYEIIEHELHQRLAMKGQMGPIHFKDGYILKKEGSGTNIRFWLDLRPTGWTRLLSPLMGLIGKLHAYETLRNLKRELAKEKIASGSRTLPSR